ncbi:S-layer homology domain-containing protein [Candidatus Villigracilis affinis]|uniref:S-layer homology domain-containing protein n=1 Tax=Candidatus Villigracilis affinis TaxID=3140682 RepID=UPI002A1CF3A4|nr:S-layer homology domain-containing protein [Anaerolineales bacterium]
MSKKIFTVLLLAVFMLAQFSIASAVAVTGDASITAIPDFSSGTDVDLDWAATGMAAGTKNILVWGREYAAVPVAYDPADCQLIATIIGTSDASGTFTYDFTTTANLNALATGDQVEFTLSVDDQTCATADVPAIDSVMGVNYVDATGPVFFYGNPPSTALVAASLDTAACNTFEYWALARDASFVSLDIAYSGFGSWNPQVTGTFAPPAPMGPTSSLLSWTFAFPATATGPWTASISPEDMAGNVSGPGVLRNAVNVVPAELEDCATFSDIAGHEDEVYVRYLATLGLISGFADGTFGADNTLTRAEASALIEISNGYDDTMLPTSAPAGCDFTDVAASDWFSGWVWQACDDGLMNGVGGGLFDPNNLLTRGQVVTILNNVATSYFVNPALFGGFIDTPNVLLLQFPTPAYPYGGYGFRTAAWTDVSVGAFYATPVQKAYGWGIAEGTSDTTFSPDQAATRGEFAKMLYRALSREF